MQDFKTKITIDSITPLTVALADFLAAFHPGPYCLRTFADQGTGFGKNYEINDIRELEAALHEQNSRDRQGIFFVVNRGGHRDADITAVTAHFVEADGLSLEDQYANLTAFSLPPSIIVKTRKSLHGYWLISDGNNPGVLADFRSVQKALAAFFQGDPVIANPSRVMRLPGFYHQKADPVLVTCLKFDPKLRYRQAQLSGAIPAEPPALTTAAVPSRAPGAEQHQVKLMLEHCAFMQHCRDNAGTLLEPLWYAMITNLVRVPDGEAAIHSLSQGYPGYDSAATEAKIRQARDCGTGPLTCETIGDWGFRCPQLGSCPAHCPRDLGIPPLPPWYAKHPRGLRFMPGILADVLAREKPVIYAGEAYYHYRDGVYHRTDDSHCRRIVQKQLFPEHATMGHINDSLGQWTLKIRRAPETLNPKPQIINLKNGLFDVAAGVLGPHDPKYLSTIQMGTAYDPEATAPRFMAFLQDCLDAETRLLVQEIFGYLLIPETCAQKAFVFVGDGGAGKSTLLAVAQNLLLGRDNVSNVPWQSLDDRFKTAEIFGKLANIFADLPSKNIDDNGMFKSITGEDTIIAERKNKDPFAFKATARLVFSCNEIPKNLGDRSEAFYRRLVIVPFLPAKPVACRDLKLKERLAAEAPGIFNWALAGLCRLRGNDFRFSTSRNSDAALDSYRIGGSSVLTFVDECCVVDDTRQVSSTQLYHAYKKYTQDFGMRAVSQKRFWSELSGEHRNLVRGLDGVSRRSLYRGIGLEMDEGGEAVGAY